MVQVTPRHYIGRMVAILFARFFIMFEFEANEAVIMESKKALEAALSTNPKAEQTLRKILRKYIMEARTQVVQGIHFKNGDPRGARNAVRTAVYKKVLGVNINIFDSRKAHGTSSYEPPRKLKPNQRGGNRVKRTARSTDIYAPLDRGFILRWQNEGVNDRTAGTRMSMPMQKY